MRSLNLRATKPMPVLVLGRLTVDKSHHGPGKGLLEDGLVRALDTPFLLRLSATADKSRRRKQAPLTRFA